MALREVLVQVIQLPTVVVEAGAWSVVSDRLPTVVPYSTVAEHLEVLDVFGLGNLGTVHGGGKARTLDWYLRHTIDLRRHPGVHEVEDGRHDIHRVAKDSPDSANVADAGRPRDDERVAHAASVGVLL